MRFWIPVIELCHVVQPNLVAWKGSLQALEQLKHRSQGGSSRWIQKTII